jgi:hypothetical protein
VQRRVSKNTVATSWLRLLTSNFAKTAFRWSCTVHSDIPSPGAASRLERPRTHEAEHVALAPTLPTLDLVSPDLSPKGSRLTAE